MEVAAGTADAAILDLTLASAMIGEGTDYANRKMVDELNVEEYGVAFRKGSDVAEAVDNAFDELWANMSREFVLIVIITTIFVSLYYIFIL